MEIKKSQGITPTEKRLSEICDSTFLKLWSYPNPFNDDGKELCDLLAVFDNHVFIFFDRESRPFDNPENDVLVAWERWERAVIEKQINTASGAEKYILSKRPIYLDAKRTIPFPLNIPSNDIHIHKIIIANGAYEACKSFSVNNIYGSLGISYTNNPFPRKAPFMVQLDKTNPVHVFDGFNLGIILGELDTFYDFTSYISAKEKAIHKYGLLSYCGEEDLLAHYYYNFDDDDKSHFIGTKDKKINGISIGEGEWKEFQESKPYKLKKLADKDSYLWDDLLQITCQNALDGTLLGDGDIFNRPSAIQEMAKEPRFSRRALAEHMIKSIKDFPDNMGPIARNISFMPSFYKGKAYVFLQLKHDNIEDYENKYRPVRREMLSIACGAAKIRFPHLKKVIGIAIDAPKFCERNSEDFALLDCENWTEKDQSYFEEGNKLLNFFNTDNIKMTVKTAQNFPDPTRKPRKIGRNEKCPCGSGKKFKRCCGK